MSKPGLPPALSTAQDAETWLRMVVEQMPAIMWTIDRQLCFTYGMGAGLEALGLQPNELVGVSLYEYFQTNDDDFLSIRSHLRALAGEEVEYEENWSGRNYRVFLEPLRGAEGAIEGAIGLAHDVTELSHSQQRYKNLFESSPIPMAVASHPEGRFLEVNAALQQALGYSAREIIGKTAEELLLWQEAEVREILSELPRRRLHGRHCAFRTKRNAERHGLISAELIHWGDQTCRQLVLEDVTDQFEAEQLLRESQQQFSDLASNVPGMLFQTSGPPDGTLMRVPFISEKVRDYFGLEPAEVKANGMLLIEAIIEEDRPRYYELAMQSMRNLTPFSMEFRVQSPAGEQRWMRATSTPRVLENGWLLYNGILFDITEQKQTEQQLRRLNEDLARHGHSAASEVAALNLKLMQEVSQRKMAEERWKSVAHGAVDFLVTVDRQRRITDINRVAQGHSHDAVIGLDASTFILEEYREQWRSNLEHLFHTGECITFESMGKGKHDSDRWYSSRMSPIYTGHEITGATIYANDITDRKNAEAELQALLASTSAKMGDEYFRALAKHTAQLLKVAHVCVCEFVQRPTAQVRSLAVWNRGEFVGENNTVPCTGPCEETSAGKQVFIDKGARQRYPHDAVLAACEAESFYGLPLISETGEVLGQLVVMDSKPLTLNPGDIPALHIFAARAASELLRKRAEEKEEAQRQAQLKLWELRDCEKQIVAGRIHDEVLPVVFAAKCSLQSLEARIARLDPELAEELRAANEFLSSAHQSGMSLMGDVRPMILEECGVLVALQDLGDHSAVNGNFKIHVENEVPQQQRFSTLFEGTLYEIVLEALHNAQRHSGALEAAVSICRQENQLVLEIVDRGCGFDIAALPDIPCGTNRMQQRAKLLGGSCCFHQTPGGGTTVLISLPEAPPAV